MDHVVGEVANCSSSEDGAAPFSRHKLSVHPCEEHEEWWGGVDRENKSVLVHGECVVDSMESKVEGDSLVCSWKPLVFSVEHESVKRVFPEGPDEDTSEEKLGGHYQTYTGGVEFP